jgi:3-acetyloctanal aminotransferase
MKFAFLVHPLSEETNYLLHFDNGALQGRWGTDPLGFCRAVHKALKGAGDYFAADRRHEPRVADEMLGLVSRSGAKAEGRLYEIPMDALEILEDPTRAVGFMEEAVGMAIDWGAKIVGLGSMTGIVGGQGVHLADQGRVPITTGNSLTVFAAIKNVHHICEEVGIDLSRETVAVVGIPGSIAAAAATLLAPQCGKLILVGRRSSTRATHLAKQLGAEFLTDIPEALSRARIVVSATSTGDCIEQAMLLPGSVVIDVAIPTDVHGTHAVRDDVLILSGGLTQVPESMPRDSKFLSFHHGMIPSCLAETMVLALEGRGECFSLGRNLDIDRVQEIGGIAQSHGFDFSRFYSFGLPLDDHALSRFQKATADRRAAVRRGRQRAQKPTGGLTQSLVPCVQELAPRAAKLHARHLNPVLMAMGGKDGIVKTFVRGEGLSLWDASGREYLDFVGGFGSMNLGHNHPAVVSAISDALTQQAPGFAQSAVNPYAANLAEELVAVAPAGLDMVFFCNSGTEAVEAALKLARKSTGRQGLLHCERSFHGKSLGALSVTGNPDYQKAFGPLVPGCDSVPYGNLELLERAVATRRYAAFIVEPIQGEAGMVVPPQDYLRAAQDACRASGTLLIVDEVQTGMGRTGSMFAVDREGVEPDIMTLAKSLGGGIMPIGAMLARRDLWHKAYGSIESFALHTSTFGGGSLACAAGLAAIRTIVDDQLAENAAARGGELKQGLARLCKECDVLREVRGEGLLLGLEFKPLPESIAAAWKAVDESGMTPYLIPKLDELIVNIPAVYAMQVLLEEYGIYTQVARSNPRVLRIQPPLTITSQQVEQFLDAVERTCGEWELGTHFMMSVISKSGMGHHHAANQNSNGQMPAERFVP